MSAIIDFFKRKLHGEPPLHPIERRAAKSYVKRRLMNIFPELLEDPKALEAAYRALDLEAHPGSGTGSETIFEMILPRDP
jgi:hypothetical protein